MNEVLRENGRRLALNRGTEPSDYIEIFERGNLLTEGCKMVTYSDLFEFVIMLIAFATFIYKMVDYLKKALIYGHTSRISS